MLLQVLGCIMVFSSCAVLGLYYSMRTGFRVNDLTELKKAFLLLKGEIEFSHAPLSEALFNISERITPKAAAFFTCAADMLRHTSDAPAAWRLAVREKLDALHLSNEDMRCVETLGDSLGFLGKRTQAEGIDMAVLYIDGSIERLRAAEAKNSRLYKNAGVLVGLLIVIVLI